MKIYSIQKSNQNFDNNSEIFVIEPLEPGQGITIGNTLRRILLSEIYGFSITNVQINDVLHEFDHPKFLREDITEILLNLKEIIIKPTISFFKNIYQKQINYKILTKIKGPVIVTGGMLNIPDKLKIINPSQYICTIVDNSELELILTIKYDKTYHLINNFKKAIFSEKSFIKEGFNIDMDTCFNPIKKVNYKVKIIHDIKGNLKESLFFEIITNGTITPKRAFLQSLNYCLKLFYPILYLNFKSEKLINFLK